LRTVSPRPTDWHVLDLDKDPTPGDPDRIRQLARALHDFADDVGEALRDLKGLAKEEEILTWAGKTAKVFAEQFGDAPKKLRKLRKSYDLAGDALASFWPDLQTAQEKADRALRDGRKARDELNAAQSSLAGAEDWVRAATAKPDGGRDVPEPDEAEVRRATRNAQHAEARRAAAQRDVESARNALDAAKKLAAQAAGLREEAARRTVTELREASDAGIPNRHWWEEIGDWVSDHWDEIVTVCKWVVAILGIIVMIVGGPLGWLVFAAALIVLADTIRKVLNGTAGWGDLLWAALDCIPATKGITSLAKLGMLWKAGGMKGLGAAFQHGITSGLLSYARNLRSTAMMGKARFWKALQSVDSRIPAPPARKPDAELISGDAVYHGNHSTAIGYDERTLANFAKVKPETGYHDVIVHGADEGMAVPGRVNHYGTEFASELHPSHLADAVRGNPAYDGGPVRLISCHSGSIAEGVDDVPIAQHVANNLGVPVKAPTDTVGTDRTISEPQVPEIANDGYWRTFLPLTD
jgi:hypothetical protein